MPTKKYKFTLIKKNNHIYSIGGIGKSKKGSFTETKECCRYNLLSKKWQKLPELNYRRSQCVVIDCEKGLLVFGGYSSGQWV